MAAPVVIDLKGSNVAALWQQAILQNVVQPAERGATRGMREWGERTMAQSKELCPVKTGALRASGMVSSVDKEGTRLTVELGYGGAAVNYAIYVHESLAAWHNPPTQAKFLEQPVLESAPQVGPTLADAMRQEMSR